MGFHKYEFPIRQIDAAEEPIKIVKGWANDDYTIGFHKVCTKRKSWEQWAATDLYTGTYITVQKTRQKCLDWIAENQKIVAEKMQEPFYTQRVMEFRELIKKELEEME